MSHNSYVLPLTLLWRYNGHDGVSNPQPRYCLLNRLFRRRSKKTSKLHVTSLCAGKSPVTGEFPAQMASNAEIVSIWWRHHYKFRFKVQLSQQRTLHYLKWTWLTQYQHYFYHHSVKWPKFRRRHFDVHLLERKRYIVISVPLELMVRLNIIQYGF